MSCCRRYRCSPRRSTSCTRSSGNSHCERGCSSIFLSKPWACRVCRSELSELTRNVVATREQRFSAKGQTEKNSVRANVFRCTHKLGHRAVRSACRKGADFVAKVGYGGWMPVSHAKNLSLTEALI